jgi:hypothetical protein
MREEVRGIPPPQGDNTTVTCRHRLLAVAALIAVVVLGATLDAQRRRGPRSFDPVRMATPQSFDGRFNFCRVAFQRSYDGDGGGWNVDYPRADTNLSIRLAELTKTSISLDAAGNPNHVVLQLTDPLLFKCPFIMMTEVGAAYITEDEVVKLREYLLKGGFLWADDFWGSYAWEVWAREIGKVLPPSEFRTIDLPTDHPMFRSQFQTRGVLQIPSINYWAGSGGGTSERYEDSAQPHGRAIVDNKGRVMVFMTHNTDVGDSWEREADDPAYFYRFSVSGYALGIDVLLYAMSH